MPPPSPPPPAEGREAECSRRGSHRPNWRKSVMTDWGGSPRNINLNLPTDYLFKPTAKFVDWLERNTTSLRMLTEDQIIQRARAALGPDLARLNNGDLAAQIREWAKSHGFVVAGSGGGAPAHARGPAVVESLREQSPSAPPVGKEL